MISVAHVLIFIGLAQYVNGWVNQYAYILIVAGVILLAFQDWVVQKFNHSYVTTPVIVTIAYVIIFLGLKAVLNTYVQRYAIVFLVAGILLLNNYRKLAEMMSSD